MELWTLLKWGKSLIEIVSCEFFTHYSMHEIFAIVYLQSVKTKSKTEHLFVDDNDIVLKPLHSIE